MTSNPSITGQTKLAFDFLQKLYLEVSYLIKEVEGLLYQEPEKFVVGRPAGYGITTRSSTGLESMYVNLWLVRKLAVFFVPEQLTELTGGMTVTKFSDDLKVLYLRIALDDPSGAVPLVSAGVLYDIRKKTDPGKSPTKFEQIMSGIEYVEKKIFSHPENINYTDDKVSLRGKLASSPLYEINDSEAIVKKIIAPVTKMYRKI